MHSVRMPTKNAIKEYAGESYYHIYSRGVNKELIFRSEKDYEVFLSFFKRYLGSETQRSSQRKAYPHYSDDIKLISYALMPNHFHLFVYQDEGRSITRLMHSLITSYSMYFNKEYSRVGHVFQSRYLALRITDEAQLQHITRYIHLNPTDWRTSTHTSLDYFLQKRSAEWVHPELVMSQSPQRYLQFMEDYLDRKELLEEIKWSLAHQSVSA